MQCMKCGRDTESGQVFCEECRTQMERYPVKPGTVVLLPSQIRKDVPKKAHPKRTIPPEEQIRELTQSRNRLAILLTATSILVILLTVLTVEMYRFYHVDILPGQNYSGMATEHERETEGTVGE